MVGPGFLPVPDEYDVFVTAAGDAARYLLVWDSPALGAEAISDLRALRERLPTLLADAGLDAPPRLAGDTALSSLVVQETTDDLWRISLAALAVNLLMLVLFLRALLTSLALLAASVLALGASLGMTVLVFQGPGATAALPRAGLRDGARHPARRPRLALAAGTGAAHAAR